jgi:hypothetical protein
MISECSCTSSHANSTRCSNSAWRVVHPIRTYCGPIDAFLCVGKGRMDQPPPQVEDPHALVHGYPNPPQLLKNLARTCFMVFLVVWYAQYYTNGPLYQLLASTAPWINPNSILSMSNPKGSIRNPHTRSVTTVVGTATRTLAERYVRSTSSWTSTETRFSTAFHAYGPRHTHTVEYMFSAVVVSTEVSEVSWTDVTPTHSRQGLEDLENGIPPNTCRNILHISQPPDDLCLPP